MKYVVQCNSLGDLGSYRPPSACPTGTRQTLLRTGNGSKYVCAAIPSVKLMKPYKLRTPVTRY